MKDPQNELKKFVDMLGFGKIHALTSENLYEAFTRLGWGSKSLSLFQRECKLLSAIARKEGIRVIGDENGYYLAVSNEEWSDYKKRRFGAIRNELESFANCERLSVKDLIKEVYGVNAEEKNYEMAL